MPFSLWKHLKIIRFFWTVPLRVSWYLWPWGSGTEAELRLDGRHRLHPDGRPLVLRAGGDDAVGGGTGRGLPLEELQDGLDVCCHLGLQSDEQTARQDATLAESEATYWLLHTLLLPQWDGGQYLYWPLGGDATLSMVTLNAERLKVQWGADVWL